MVVVMSLVSTPASRVQYQKLYQKKPCLVTELEYKDVAGARVEILTRYSSHQSRKVCTGWRNTVNVQGGVHSHATGSLDLKLVFSPCSVSCTLDAQEHQRVMDYFIARTDSNKFFEKVRQLPAYPLEKYFVLPVMKTENCTKFYYLAVLGDEKMWGRESNKKQWQTPNFPTCRMGITMTKLLFGEILKKSDIKRIYTNNICITVHFQLAYINMHSANFLILLNFQLHFIKYIINMHFYINTKNLMKNAAKIPIYSYSLRVRF